MIDIKRQKNTPENRSLAVHHESKQGDCLYFKVSTPSLLQTLLTTFSLLISGLDSSSKPFFVESYLDVCSATKSLTCQLYEINIELPTAKYNKIPKQSLISSFDAPTWGLCQ
jgi:hypothetical protein